MVHCQIESQTQKGFVLYEEIGETYDIFLYVDSKKTYVAENSFNDMYYAGSVKTSEEADRLLGLMVETGFILSVG